MRSIGAIALTIAHYCIIKRLNKIEKLTRTETFIFSLAHFVDVFFTISGVLLCKVVLEKTKK